METRHLVVMGVSGTGKSAVGKPLADRLGYVFAEGDDFHPPANIAKMSAGTPLNDQDRMPWLDALATWTRDRSMSGESTVLACSALKRAYRDVLRTGAPQTFFVLLNGDKALILERMRHREHFMPPSLLDSQFATLQPLAADEAGITVDIASPVDEIVDKVLVRLETEQAR